MRVLSTPNPRATDGSRTRAGRRLDLDVVRGLAIVLALGWHFSRERSGNAVLDALTWPGHSFGWAGVDLFFVLSGFLLGRLVLTEQARTGRFDGRRFTARRVLKLWPVLYVFLGVQALGGPEPWTSYLWQRPARPELSGHVTDPPLVPGRGGALLSRPGPALPPVRPAPRLPPPAGRP